MGNGRVVFPVMFVLVWARTVWRIINSQQSYKETSKIVLLIRKRFPEQILFYDVFLFYVHGKQLW